MNLQTTEIKLYDFHHLPDQTKAELAESISDHTRTLHNTEHQVVVLKPADILKKYIAKVALTDEFVLAGFAGANKIGKHRNVPMSKVGSLFVKPEHWGQRIGFELVSTVTDDVLKNGDYPFAFCTPYSEKIFHEAGYIPATQDEIPNGQLSQYRNRPWIYYAGMPPFVYPARQHYKPTEY